jgi:dynein heavy chain 2, cytosolic
VRKTQGLPSDVLSNENAIMVLYNMTVPLLIDPSGQATDWLHCSLADRKPEVVSCNDESFIRSLELAGIINIKYS